MYIYIFKETYRKNLYFRTQYQQILATTNFIIKNYLQFFIIVKIDVYSYKALRESIRADILIKLINLMLRSAECGLQSYYNLLKEAGITWEKTHS